MNVESSWSRYIGSVSVFNLAEFMLEVSSAMKKFFRKVAKCFIFIVFPKKMEGAEGGRERHCFRWRDIIQIESRDQRARRNCTTCRWSRLNRCDRYKWPLSGLTWNKTRHYAGPNGNFANSAMRATFEERKLGFEWRIGNEDTKMEIREGLL